MQVKAGNIASRPHYVAEVGGRVVGFYGFEPEAEGIGLDYLFIDNEFVGRGIGRALWHHAVATARTLGHAAMIVVSDPNAEGFYLRMGCRRMGTRPSDLENGRQLPLLRYDLSLPIAALTQHRREVYQRASNERGRHGPQDRAQEDRNTHRPQTPLAATPEGRKEERSEGPRKEGCPTENRHQKEACFAEGEAEGGDPASRQAEEGAAEEAAALAPVRPLRRFRSRRRPA
jgi:GNAT superfamily N-acetyltransferase